MSYPNHITPHQPRANLSGNIFNNDHKRNEFLRHGTAGIAAFTLGRLFMLVPIQNYRNASIVSGELFEEPVNVTEGQCTELVRVFSEYFVKNTLERIISRSGNDVNGVNDLASRFVASFLTAPIHIVRVKESKGIKQGIIKAYENFFSIERCLFLGLHETLACIFGNIIYDKGLFKLEGNLVDRFEINLRLSQLLSRILLTPLEIFAKRVAISENTDNVWQKEFENLKREANDKGFFKYLVGVAFWSIPEAVSMVVEKVAYRQIVDNWPFKV